ncbi:MAG: NAD-dependent protein deacylase [Bacilli bacterium]|nr:NAD-dependent protein deacylase [Bacilli bacterium]
MEKIDKLKEIIKSSNNIVFFGGAGVSTESGIPDFRSKDGLYNQKYDYPPEEILSHTFFYYNTEYFYKFYKDKMNSLSIKPNITHLKLKELEKNGKLRCIITQNIDGLDIKAGSKNVLEIHGSIYRNYCTKCNKFYDAEYVFKSNGIPLCECGGIIKPDVVLYEEPLNNTFDEAINYIRKCDTLIVAGTSLTVYPAASLIRYFNGKNLILINKDKTKYDDFATLVFNQNMSEIFKEL